MGKYSHIFDTGHLLQDLKGKSVRGGIYTMGATVLSQILQLGSIVILARLLLPEYFGLVSMVTAVVVLAERFKHMGLSTATIQQAHITHEQVSTLFWINASAGVLIAVMIAGSSKIIASFYEEPSLIPVTMALSLSFVFGGLNVQHEALLRRQMKFRALASAQLLANVLSIGLAIELAMQGFTYWALVWKEVARPAIELVGIWVACRWWPGLPAPRSGVGPLLRVGRDIVSVDMVYWACRNADQIFIGKFAGAYSLGLYRQAFQLMATPMSQLTYPVGSVALPSLNVLQDDPDRYQRYYEKFLRLLSLVSIPLATYMAIFSEDIIHIVLGEKWLEAAWIFRLLAIAALIEPLLATSSMVMITQKKTRRFFWWAVMYGVSHVLAFYIGVQWGAIGVAAGYALAHYAVMIPSLWIAFRGTPLWIGLFFRAIAMPAIFSLIMAGILIVLSYNTSALHSISRIGISVLTGGIVYSALWMMYPRARKRLFDDASSILSTFKSAGSASK